MVLQIFLFLFAASLDNLLVGIGYGIKQIRIGPGCNLLIATLSGVLTLAAMLAGQLAVAADVFSARLELQLGSGLLILIGAYFIFSELRLKYGIRRSNKPSRDLYEEFLRHPEIADRDHSSTIDIKEALIIGVALAVNNSGLGIGASIIGLSIATCCLLSFLFSLLFLQLGYRLGNSIFAKYTGQNAGYISGILIIVLGFYTLLC